MQMYIHITSSAYKLLSVLSIYIKIYSIHNVNYRLAVELQSTYQIIASKTSKEYIISTLTKKLHYQNVILLFNR